MLLAVRRSHSTQQMAVVRSAVSAPSARGWRRGAQTKGRPPATTEPSATSQRVRQAQTAEEKRAAHARRTVPPRRPAPQRPRPKVPPPPPPPSKQKLLLLERARRILNLAPNYAEADLRAAFRREVKAAHPDQKGDPARFRLVMTAYRFLRTELAKP